MLGTQSMMSARRVILLFVLMVAGASRVAAASPRSEMRRQFEKGKRLYKQEKYDRAKEAFEAAYDLIPSPGLLFNLGQCHRRLGDAEPALAYYREYLRLRPEASNRAQVEKYIAEMEAAMPAPAPEPAPDPPVEAKPPPAPEPPGVALPEPAAPEAPPPPIVEPAAVAQAPEPATWPAWTTIGLGVASSVVGIVFVVQARNAADEANDCILRREPQETCQPAIDRHSNRRILGGVTLGVGSVAIISGAAWLYLLSQQDGAGIAVDVGVGSGRVTAVLGWDY